MSGTRCAKKTQCCTVQQAQALRVGKTLDDLFDLALDHKTGPFEDIDNLMPDYGAKLDKAFAKIDKATANLKAAGDLVDEIVDDFTSGG